MGSAKKKEKGEKEPFKPTTSDNTANGSSSSQLSATKNKKYDENKRKSVSTSLEGLVAMVNSWKAMVNTRKASLRKENQAPRCIVRFAWNILQ